jgi:hypothetical protein
MGWVACAVALFGCGDDGRGGAASGSASGITGIPGTSGETDPDPSGNSNDDDDEEKLDIGSNETEGTQTCNNDGNSGGGGNDDEDEIDFSYIWIANSVEGTISKIDTQSMVELGRYIVRDDSLGNPSRTSVSITGDVAVANRAGGVTKVLAVAEECPDLNGDGTVTTSTSGTDVLPWGTDECVAWSTPFAYESQRPVAWSAGEWNPSTCEYDNQKLWTSGATSAGGIDVLLLEGDSGEVENMVNIPEVMFDGYGIYGAAVDGEGNFWGSQLGGGKLVYVNRESFEYKTWDIPIAGYGMTVDHQGYVWVCSNDVARFDPETEMFQTATVGGSGGCMEDGNGTLWLASTSLVGIDTTTMMVVKTIPIPNYVHGVSIDFYGYVWGVTHSMPDAYRADPVTNEVSTFTGLNGPYTYSDMTGFALKNAGTIPTPQG